MAKTLSNRRIRLGMVGGGGVGFESDVDRLRDV